MTLNTTPISLDADLCEPLIGEPTFDTFAACLNARGMYESQRFVLRLSPVVHELVNSVVEKSERGETSFSGEELQAYSTYIHETVHWWQHKGSTSGFIRSVLYPIQTHSSISDLNRISAALGPQKPIQNVALRGELGLLSKEAGDIRFVANAVTNNFMDTEFYLALTLKPTLDVDLYRDPYFQAAGHSFLITYALVLGAIREMIDEEGSALPEPQALIDGLEDLARRRVRGYYYATEIIRAPVGLLDLYEGQARFIQLQFLAMAADDMTFAEARDLGMLEGVYGTAFQSFLQLSKSAEPELIDDPLVALFLFICDMSINPTAGFPSPIESYENFFLDADPGIRFATLCQAVAENAPELRTFVKQYSADEYRSLARKFGDLTGFGDHLAALGRLHAHSKSSSEATALMEEHRSFKFRPSNIVLRVFMAEFLEFLGDRLEFPEFFCWTGYWLTRGGGDQQQGLWLKHLSLFSDKADDGAVFARKHPGRDENDVLELLNQFYAAVLLYDLTKQWVLIPGPFRYNYSWLSSSGQEAEFIKHVKGVFRKSYGVDVDQFALVDRPEIPRS